MKFHKKYAVATIFRFLVCVFLAVLLSFNHLSFALEEGDEQRNLLLSHQGNAKWVTLPTGKQCYYFAQNDERWKAMWYVPKEGGYITFGDGGCVATTLANVLINLVPKEHLEQLSTLSSSPFMLDSVAVAKNLGHALRKKFEVKGEDMVTFLPLVLGQYATGNNRVKATNYRSASFYNAILELFNLNVEKSNTFEDVEHVLKNGGLVVTSSGGETSPIARGGHFFVIADADDENLYILDSLQRENYKRDKKKIMHLLSPGVVKVSKKHIKNLDFNYFLGISPKK